MVPPRGRGLNRRTRSIGRVERSESDEGFIRLGSVAEVQDEEIRGYELGQVRVAVANLDGRLFSFSDACTHAGCLLSEGAVTDDATVVCSEDGSEFDLETGEPIHGP